MEVLSVTRQPFEPELAERTAAHALPDSVSESFGWGSALGAADLGIVRVASRSAQRPTVRALAVALSTLGNGWIYFPMFGVIVAKWGLLASRIVVPAAVNAILLHAIYPRLKRGIGRRRPFEADTRLPSLLKTLDAHSFPSGHTMTLAGVLTPVVMFWPAAALTATAVGLGVAWSRVAAAHHYPSDVVAGAALGIGVGYPATVVVGALWG